MNLDLSSRKALVCGGSQGIGEYIAISLADLGAKITLVARNKEKLERVKSRLKGAGHQVVVADLDNDSDVKKLVEYTANTDFDIVINNTGGPAPGDVSNATIDQFEKAFRMHLHASHQIMQAIMPGMKERKYGRFINVISSSVKIPIKGLGVSNTVRGAMSSWSKTLSLELGQYGITVNNILPGFIDTDRLHGLIQSTAERQGVSSDQVTGSMLGTIPANRFGKPEEVGDLAAFLASPAAAYINGTNILIDGGKTGSF